MLCINIKNVYTQYTAAVLCIRNYTGCMYTVLGVCDLIDYGD